MYSGEMGGGTVNALGVDLYTLTHCLRDSLCVAALGSPGHGRALSGCGKQGLLSSRGARGGDSSLRSTALGDTVEQLRLHGPGT